MLSGLLPTISCEQSLARFTSSKERADLLVRPIRTCYSQHRSCVQRSTPNGFLHWVRTLFGVGALQLVERVWRRGHPGLANAAPGQGQEGTGCAVRRIELSYNLKTL